MLVHNQLQSILLHPETDVLTTVLKVLSCLYADDQFGNDCVKKVIRAGRNRIPSLGNSSILGFLNL